MVYFEIFIYCSGRHCMSVSESIKCHLSRATCYFIENLNLCTAMLEKLSKCIKQEVQKFVPLSLIPEVTCFIFNDYHPLDKHCYDIVVCTTKGELIKLLHRKTISSLSLNTATIPLKIDVFRNTKNNVYFLVSTTDELIIINRNENLSVMKKIQNYQRYVIDDSTCTGKSYLKVWCCDDALPIEFDEELEILEDPSLKTNSDNTDCNPLFITSMKTKLNQAKYVVSYNTKLYEDILNLRHKAAFSVNQNIYPNEEAAIFQDTSKKAQTQLRLANDTWIKMCNRQIVIALDICNKSSQILDDLEIILHGDCSLISYQYKVYEQISLPPYWKESLKNIKPNSQVTLALIINVEELKNLSTRNGLKGIITYTISGKEYLLSINKISILMMDLLDEILDVLSVSDYDTKTFLAILSTTVKMEVSLLLPHNENDVTASISDLFRIHLKMQKIPNSDVIIHRESSYHPLNGVTICFDHNKKETALGTIYFATTYTRCPSQLILLMKYMYDVIPYRLLLLPRDMKISSTMLNNQIYIDNNLPSEQQFSGNVIGFGKSLLDQITLILKYYDKCIVKMGESNNQQVLEMIGEKIDLFISGKEEFHQFRSKLYDDILKGIQCLKNKKSVNTMIEDD